MGSLDGEEENEERLLERGWICKGEEEEMKY
jgi:hypothetical protein